MRALCAGLLGAVLGASAATAADPLVYVPMDPTIAPAQHNWAGWYAGGYFGGLVGGEFTHDGAGNPGLSGVDAGVQLHYNAIVGNNWILSPFVAATVPVQHGQLFGVDVKVDWAAQAGIRLGYAHDRWLPYGFLGGMVGQATTTNLGPETKTHVGFTAGTGVEYAVDDRWAVGARYAYYSLGPQDYFGPGGTQVGWSGHSVVGTISFKLH